MRKLMMLAGVAALLAAPVMAEETETFPQRETYTTTVGSHVLTVSRLKGSDVEDVFYTVTSAAKPGIAGASGYFDEAVASYAEWLVATGVPRDNVLDTMIDYDTLEGTIATLKTEGTGMNAVHVLTLTNTGDVVFRVPRFIGITGDYPDAASPAEYNLAEGFVVNFGFVRGSKAGENLVVTTKPDYDEKKDEEHVH